jgi:hypothetical protein
MDNERLIEYMIEDLREVKKDVKSLLQFKWQLMGYCRCGNSTCNWIGGPMKYLKYAFISVLFVLLVFGIYKAIESKEFTLAIITLSVLFIFVFVMNKTGKVKNFHIGGDKLSVSVNEDDNEPKT